MTIYDPTNNELSALGMLLLFASVVWQQWLNMRRDILKLSQPIIIGDIDDRCDNPNCEQCNPKGEDDED